MRLSISLLSALLVASACASSNAPPPDTARDRVLVIDTDGNVLRQSTGDERSRFTFNAPIDQVWRALATSYADLGIPPTIADRVTGRFGTLGFVMPSRLMKKPIDHFFDCGSTLTGPMVSAGQVTAIVVTTLSALSDSTTSAVTRVTGTLRRNDGFSGDPVVCASTGAIEDDLRRATELRLAVTH